MQERKRIMMGRVERVIAKGQNGDDARRMREFSSHYPELVDKYKIKYPIEDELLNVMPSIHNQETI